MNILKKKLLSVRTQLLESSHASPFSHPPFFDCSTYQFETNIAEHGSSKLARQRLNQNSYKHLTSQNVQEPVFRKFIAAVKQGVSYSLKRLKGPSQQFLQSKRVILQQSQNSKRKFLVLDLDQTLIHSAPTGQPHEVSLQLEDYQSVQFNVRPYAYQFLSKMSQLYNIYVFTASREKYAKPIVEYLNRNHKTIQSMLTRSHCLQTKSGLFIKDLRIIGNRCLKDIVMVDNWVHSFALNLNNGIPILQYKNDDKDSQLRHIQKWLWEMKDEVDVRHYISQRIGIEGLADVQLESMEEA